jgi:DNA-binding transcriptional MerR regulator
VDSSAGSWTAGQVARHLGIAESTLRSWHRRYGIGPQGSEPGRYRRYSEADVARLRRMLDLINQGMLASEAALAVQAGQSEVVSTERDVADVLAAARAGDSERCRAMLDNVLARRGVVDAWEAVCRPALAYIDAEQRIDPDCMDLEHALSWAMLGALHRVPSPPLLPGTDLVLLACVESEHHTLPLAALSAALASRRIAVRMLGAATPTQSLVRAVRETAPSAVVLWSQRSDTAGEQILEQLGPYPVTRFTAGPGWPPDGVAGVEHLTDLPHALDRLAGSSSGPPRPVAAPGQPPQPPNPPRRPVRPPERGRPPQPDPTPQLDPTPQPDRTTQPGHAPQPGRTPQPDPAPPFDGRPSWPAGPEEPQSPPAPPAPEAASGEEAPGPVGSRYSPFPISTSRSLQ